MLTSEERDQLVAGAAAEKLVAYAEWKLWEDSLRGLRESWVRRALAQGETEFAKGCVFAIDTILASPQETIEIRRVLIERERALRAQVGGGDDEVYGVEERVP